MRPRMQWEGVGLERENFISPTRAVIPKGLAAILGVNLFFLIYEIFSNLWRIFKKKNDSRTTNLGQTSPKRVIELRDLVFPKKKNEKLNQMVGMWFSPLK